MRRFIPAFLVIFGAALAPMACGPLRFIQYSCRPQKPVALAGQVGDATYCAEVAEPAYAFGQGPRVLFDEGHHNYGKISADALSPQVGRYHAFGELLKADGYQVQTSSGVITSVLLQKYHLLVIVAPLPGDYFLSSGPNPVAYSGQSALQDSEVNVIRNWVEQGGSLLINTEHSPFLPSAKNLLNAFGLSVEPDAYDVMTLPGQPLHISAPTHPILVGRSRRENIAALPTPRNVGGGVHLTSSQYPAIALTKFGIGLMMTETLSAGLANQKFQILCRNKKDSEPQSPECAALQKIKDAGTKIRPTSGDEPMKVLKVGKGRVAVFTEFSTITSQIGEPNTPPYGGLQDPGYTQLALNTLHWLSGLLED